MKLPSLSTTLSVLMIILVCAPLPTNAESLKRKTEPVIKEPKLFTAPFEGDGMRLVVFDDQIILFKIDEKSECEGSYCRYDVLVTQKKVFNLPVKQGQLLLYGQREPFFLGPSKFSKFNFQVKSDVKDDQSYYTFRLEYQVGAKNDQIDCQMNDAIRESPYSEFPIRKDAERIGR